MYRSIQVKIWEDRWFFNLKEREKLVYLYLITSSHTNSAGVINVPFELMSIETGLTPKQFTDSLNKLKEKVLITNDGIVYIKNFAKYQLSNSSEKFKTAIASALKELPSNTLKEIIDFDPKILEILPEELIKELQNTLSIPYLYPTHTLSIPYPYPTDTPSTQETYPAGTLSTQETYPTDTLPITETVTETEQNINIKNKRFKDFRNSDFEKEEPKDKPQNPSESIPGSDVKDNPPTVPPDPPTVPPVLSIEDDFTRDSNRIQTAYKRLFNYDRDTSCLVSLLQGNTPDDIIDVMRWASKAHHWIVKSVPPEKFLENFKKIKDTKRDVDTYDARFSNGKSPPAGVDKEFLEKLEMFVKSKRLE